MTIEVGQGGGGGGAVDSVNGKVGVVVLTKTDLALGNVNNTADTNKPVSTPQSTAIGLRIAATEKGVLNGVATLDGSVKIPEAQITEIVMMFRGQWNPATNTPTLADGVGSTGDTYRVSTPGTIDLGGGSNDYQTFDQLYYDGGSWRKAATSGTVTVPEDQTINVAPAATGNYIKRNNKYFNASPSVDSDEHWYAQWLEPKILDTGFYMGNPADGQGGLNGIGMAMTALGDFGYIRNYDMSIQIGNGTDPISGYNVAAMNQYVNVDNNASVEFLYGFPISLTSQVGSTVANTFGVNVNFNLDNVTNSAVGFSLGGNIGFSGPGTYYQGLNIQPTVTGVVNATGINVSMANVTASGSKYAFNTDGNVFIGGNLQLTGTFNFNGDLQVGSIQGFKPFVPINGGSNPSAVNSCVTQMNATGTVANCDTIGLSTPSLINLDASFQGTSGGFGMGLASLALPNLIYMEAGSNLDYLTAAVYANVFDATNTGGTIGQLYGCRSVNIYSAGPAQTVTRSYNFFADYFAGDFATDSWGFYDGGAKYNYITNCLKIGGTDTTTNTDVGLELEGKALLLASMDTTARNALTAVAGMVIFNTTTTTMQYYNGSTWV